MHAGRRRPGELHATARSLAAEALAAAAVAALLLLPPPGTVAGGPPSLGLETSSPLSAESLSQLVRAMGLERAGPLPYTPPAHPPTGTTYYVSNLGSDTAPCSEASPCRQVSEALALVSAGDTITVTNGTFLGFDVDSIDGSPSAPITIVSPGRGSVLVNTVNRSDNRDIVHFETSAWITLDGFQAYEANRAAVRIDQSDNITVSNCTFGDETTWGIFTDFDHNSAIDHDRVYGSVQQHGIYVSNSPIAPTLRWNLVYNNSEAGIQINADATQGGWGIESGGDLEDNVIYGNGASGAAGLNFDGVWNTRVVNNLIYDEHATGIVNYVDDGAAGPHGMVIEDNTVVLASNGRWALQFLSTTGENYVRDNILDNLNPSHGGEEFGTWDDVNNTSSDYNIQSSVTVDASGVDYSLAQWQALGYEPHSLSADPSALFVDPDAGDYELLSTSPAIGAGTYLANVSLDLAGNVRPPGGPYDIGCYQYVAPGPSVEVGGNPLDGPVPLTVAFSSTVSGGSAPYHYTWQYGDGSPTSGASDPTHTYNASGTFPVELSLTDGTGATAYGFLNVSVSAASGFSVSVAASPMNGPAPLLVSFDPTLSGGNSPFGYFWRFGDGGAPSHASDPTHRYNVSGSYVASLQVNESSGRPAWANTTITVGAATSPLAVSLLTNATSVEVGVPVALTPSVSDGAPPYACLWWLNSTNTTMTGCSSTSLRWSHPGTYTYKVWATDAASTIAQSNAVAITVSALPLSSLPKLVAFANSTWAGQSVCTGSGGSPTADLSGNARGGLPPYTFSWSFGAASAVTTGRNVTHTFGTGPLTASLEVNDDGGHFAWANLTLLAAAPCPPPASPGFSLLGLSTASSLLLVVALIAASVAVVAVVLMRRGRGRHQPSVSHEAPTLQELGGPPPS